MIAQKIKTRTSNKSNLTKSAEIRIRIIRKIMK